MIVEVDAHDAEARLPELLRRVDAGERFTIIRHGRSIAELTPCPDNIRRSGEEAVAAMRATKRMTGVATAELEQWLVEGRQ